MIAVPSAQMITLTMTNYVFCLALMVNINFSFLEAKFYLFFLTAYHSKCIDPWLTKNRKVCPVCKRRVIIGNEQPSDHESDTDDETAPLINADAGTQGGTFNNQRVGLLLFRTFELNDLFFISQENPFQQAQREVDREISRMQRTARPRYHNLGYSSSSSDDEEDSQHLVRPVSMQYGDDDSQGN